MNSNFSTMLNYLVLFFVILLPGSIFSQTQLSVSSDTSNGKIVFLSPNDGDVFVPRRTTIIVRVSKNATDAYIPKNFNFDVKGESSGIHSGSVILSDDGQTVVFKPEQPFSLNEKVHIKFFVRGLENILTISYAFQTTPTNDLRQNYLLKLFHTKEKTENLEFQKETEAKTKYRADRIFDAVASNFPVTIDFADSSKNAPGNVFLTLDNNVPTPLHYLFIGDNKGKAIFERDMKNFSVDDFKLGLNNTLLYFKQDTVLSTGNSFGIEYLLNSDYVVIDSFQCGNGYLADGHDFELLPNGHSLLIAFDAMDSVDMRKVTGDPNASSHATVIGAIIQELDTKKNVVFQWRSWDHFNITDATHLLINNPNETVIDYAHINSIVMDTDGMIIASFRHMDEITKINPINGHIVWRWGGKHNYFTFLGDTLQFSYQHHVRRIANGHITLWDNGNFHWSVWGDGSYHDTAYSRAVEYELNESGPLTAKTVWEFSDIPFSFAGGSVQRLANGNTFIGLGFFNSPNAVEVMPTGEKVFQLSLPVGTFNYRSFRYEFPQPVNVVHQSAVTDNFGFQSIYPNPVTSVTNITFVIPDAGTVQISMLNILGQTVLHTEEKCSAAGTYTSVIDMNLLPSGTYYCKVSYKESMSIKMVVVNH